MTIIEPLFEGRIDIVGDVHGEFESLISLLGHLGYDDDGHHPDGRHLVFVGDLVDRGPDSPAVVEKVMDLADRGIAQCILGNHELNILLDDSKHGSEWYFLDDRYDGPPMTAASEEQKQRFLAYFRTLPLTLERADLRIVHACWHQPALDTLLSDGGEGIPISKLYAHYSAQVQRKLSDSRLMNAVQKEKEQYDRHVKYGHNNPKKHWPTPVMLDAHGECAEIKQMGNPIKVLTSGIERKASKPFPANGEFRFADRIKWWDEYTDNKPVIVGHYWRKFRDIQDDIQKELPPDLFEGIAPNEWMGQKKNVYCVDFSVGLSAQKRTRNESTDGCSLAALRWPEQIVVFDDSSVTPLKQ